MRQRKKKSINFFLSILESYQSYIKFGITIFHHYIAKLVLRQEIAHNFINSTKVKISPYFLKSAWYNYTTDHKK